MGGYIRRERISIVNTENRLRVSVLGSTGVGKTSIINRFLHNKFIEHHNETIEDFHRGSFETDGKEFGIDILDTCGSDEFPALRDNAIATADAFILVYSAANEKTFNKLEMIRNEIMMSKHKGKPMVIVANKIDRRVSRDKAGIECQVSLEWNCKYILASAKYDTNIVQVFKSVLNVSNVTYPLSPAVRQRRSIAEQSKIGTITKKKNKCKKNPCPMC